MLRILACTLLPAALALPAAAQTVYKSVDEQGNVTYSGEPPPTDEAARVKEIELPAGPSEQDQAEAIQRMREMEARAGRLDQQREIRQEASQGDLAAVRQELTEARAALAEAREMRFEDWQYIAGGGRVLKPSYHERVAAAEQRVRTAEQALQRLR